MFGRMIRWRLRVFSLYGAVTDWSLAISSTENEKTCHHAIFVFVRTCNPGASPNQQAFSTRNKQERRATQLAACSRHHKGGGVRHPERPN